MTRSSSQAWFYGWFHAAYFIENPAIAQFNIMYKMQEEKFLNLFVRNGVLVDYFGVGTVSLIQIKEILKMVKFVTCDLKENAVAVYDDRGNYMSSIYRPGVKSAQSMGTQVVLEDHSMVVVYECASGYPTYVSGRYKR